ncbi:MAG: cupin domain-containing protein [Treponema sp.]|nr:cupin domain-containing protein [Treponema sp.]
MAINIRRFDPANSVPGHEGTILASSVLPDTMTAPFWHQYGYLKNKGSAMAGHAHSADEIYIVLSGTGQVILGGKTRAVSAGNTIVIPSGQWHTMLCTDKDEAPLLWAALWWDKIPGSSVEKTDTIYVQHFEKDKAHKAHEGTILADAVVPSVMKPPFGHAYGYLEDGNEMELHAHPTDEFYIVYSGKGFVIVGDEKRAVEPGDVIEIPRNVMHSMTAQNKSSFLWAAFWWEPVIK